MKLTIGDCVPSSSYWSHMFVVRSRDSLFSTLHRLCCHYIVYVQGPCTVAYIAGNLKTIRASTTYMTQVLGRPHERPNVPRETDQLRVSAFFPGARFCSIAE